MRFLKKEWDDTEIPQESLLRARNRAWRRIQEGDEKPRRRILAWPWLLPAGAATAALLAILLFWPWASQPQLQPLPLPQPPATLVAEKGPLASSPVVKEAAADPAWVEAITAPPNSARYASDSPQPPAQLAQDAQGQDNLKTKTKIIFRLPRSGVRMIWMTQTSEGE
ncbi:MAG TPA: hypothetical protein VLV83_08090 [Acidobacteriota bacterium]|nr:hypothetical protein [Acidobacteriota bacterium]